MYDDIAPLSVDAAVCKWLEVFLNNNDDNNVKDYSTTYKTRTAKHSSNKCHLYLNDDKKTETVEPKSALKSFVINAKAFYSNSIKTEEHKPADAEEDIVTDRIICPNDTHLKAFQKAHLILKTNQKT